MRRRLFVGGIALALAIAVILWGAGAVLVVSVNATPPDAIVSLASHEWERLPEAARLAHRYPASIVILTVPPHVTPHNCHDCAQRVAWLAHAGVPSSRVRVLNIEGDGTYAEARTCRHFAESQPSIRRVLVVTSPYHTRRALAAFRDAFNDTNTIVGVASGTESPARPRRWWLAPYDRWYVGYEWLATAYYIGWHHISPRLFLVDDSPEEAANVTS